MKKSQISSLAIVIVILAIVAYSYFKLSPKAVLQMNYDQNTKVQYMTQGASMIAAMSEARYKAEAGLAPNVGYDNVCIDVGSWIIQKYNEGSKDDIGINKYDPLTSLAGLECIDSKEKYAFSVPVVQQNGSTSVKCVDSTGFFRDGSVSLAAVSCVAK